MAESFKNREGLIHILHKVLDEISKNESQINQADQLLLTEHGIQPSLIYELIVNRSRIEALVDSDLIVVANSLYNGAKYKEMNPADYFDEKKIEHALNKKNEEKSIFPLVFENALIGSAEDSMVILSYKTIARLWLDGVIEYNPNIQRKPTVRTSKRTGKTSISNKIYKKNIREIGQMMVEGKYLPDTTMTFNVFSDGAQDVAFDLEDRSITIHKAVEIDVIDGFHRIEAIQWALEQKPDMDGYLYVSLRFYDENGAKFYLGQFNSGTAFDKTHTRLLKNYRMEDKITTDLIAKSELNGHVSKEKSPNIRLGELTTFTILADSIHDSFEIANNRQKLEVTEALIRFFDYLLGGEPKAFKTDIEESSKTSWSNYHNTFPGYIVLAKKLYDKHGSDFPLKEVDKVIKLIDFTKNDQNELSIIYGASRESNSTQVKKRVGKYFAEIADRVLDEGEGEAIRG